MVLTINHEDLKYRPGSYRVEYFNKVNRRLKDKTDHGLRSYNEAVAAGKEAMENDENITSFNVARNIYNSLAVGAMFP